MCFLKWCVGFRVCCEELRKAAFALIWKSLLEAYKALKTPVQFTSMSLKSFKPDKKKSKFPKLSSKGAECKHLLKPLLRVWDEHSRKTAHDDKVRSTLVTLDMMQDILDDYSTECFLPVPVSEKFKQLTDDFLAGYTWLGLRADERGQFLFTAAPKLHYLWHLAARSVFLSPRRVACFIDEDFVKFMKRIAARSTAGTQPHLVPAAVFEKLKWHFHLKDVVVS